jgi:hypothetical protein
MNSCSGKMVRCRNRPNRSIEAGWRLGPPLASILLFRLLCLIHSGQEDDLLYIVYVITKEGSQGRYKKVLRECPGRLAGKVQEGSQGRYSKVLREDTGRFSGNEQEGYQERYRKVLGEGTGRFSGNVQKSYQGRYRKVLR